MRFTNGALWACVIAAVTVAGCAPRDRIPPLREFLPDGTPEEFSILPFKPLELPPDYQVLPQPIDAGNSRVDKTPLADAIRALGGDPSVMHANQGADDHGALIAAASRLGNDPDIREVLAEEDARFRRRATQFNRKLFRKDEYRQAYRVQMIDPRKEAIWLRQNGIATPLPPPAESGN